jgi:transposase
MLNDISAERIYLALGPTDMRKSIDGLAAIVQEAFDLDLFSNAWFVFCGKGRDRLKILRWDHNGFWLYYRRLERGRFQWPAAAAESPTRMISRRQLMWLLDGLTLEQCKAHPEVHARSVI